MKPNERFIARLRKHAASLEREVQRLRAAGCEYEARCVRTAQGHVEQAAFELERKLLLRAG